MSQTVQQGLRVSTDTADMSVTTKQLPKSDAETVFQPQSISVSI